MGTLVVKTRDPDFNYVAPCYRHLALTLGYRVDIKCIRRACQPETVRDSWSLRDGFVPRWLNLGRR